MALHVLIEPTEAASKAEPPTLRLTYAPLRETGTTQAVITSIDSNYLDVYARADMAVELVPWLTQFAEAADKIIASYDG